MSDVEPPSRGFLKYEEMLAIALDEARLGLAEGGAPIGAALLDATGALLGRGRNRRLQDGDPTLHAEVLAFRSANPRTDYRETILVTTLAPCWFCSGLVRQFGIGTVVVGDSSSYGREALDWLREAGVRVVELHSPDSELLLQHYLQAGGDIRAPAAPADVGR
jgi:creatinine deaminase